MAESMSDLVASADIGAAVDEGENIRDRVEGEQSGAIGLALSSSFALSFHVLLWPPLLLSYLHPLSS